MILTSLAAALTSGTVRVIDLTQTLGEDTPIIALPPQFGPSAPFRSTPISRYDDRGPAWAWNDFSCGEHTGTHFDAPVHWVTGRDLPDNTTDTVPVQHLVAPAVVLDFSAEAAADADFLMTAAHVDAWESRHGRIPAGCWVLFRTDWSKREGAAYANLREDGAHTPGPAPDAVRLLIERDIRGFAVETIGTDAGQAFALDPPYPAHTLFHGAGKYGLQCLGNLDQLPPTGAIVIGAPLKIRDGTGSPLRVLALVG